MTTTTITAILRHVVGLLEDLTPCSFPELPWNMVRDAGRPLPLRPYVGSADGTTMWRRFEIEAQPIQEPRAVQDPGATFASELMTIKVAYPTQPRRVDNAFELAALLAEDGLTLRDAINSTGGRANVAHLSTRVNRPTVDRSREDVWFLTLTATVAFYVEQRTRT